MAGDAPTPSPRGGARRGEFLTFADPVADSGNMATEPEGSANRGSPRQFGLGSLLWFTFACSAYASTIASMALTVEPGPPPWHAVLAITATWLVLGIIYLRLHSVAAFLVHCCGPGVIAVASLEMFILPANLIVFLTRVITLGCFLGTLLRFPAFDLVILYRMSVRQASVRRTRPGTEADST